MRINGSEPYKAPPESLAERQAAWDKMAEQQEENREFYRKRGISPMIDIILPRRPTE